MNEQWDVAYVQFWRDYYKAEREAAKVEITRLEAINADLLGACEAALEIIGVYDEGVGLTLEERMLERTILVAIAKARGGDR